MRNNYRNRKKMLGQEFEILLVSMALKRHYVVCVWSDGDCIGLRTFRALARRARRYYRIGFFI